MLSAPEFSSLIVSRPGSDGRLFTRLRVLAVAAVLYGSALAGLALSPFLVLEVMDPSRAGIIIDFHQPRSRGDNRRAGDIRKGVRHGRTDARPAAAPKPTAARTVPRPADALVPPPESESTTTGGPDNGDSDSRGPAGDPNGTGDKLVGVIRGGCADCPETGPGGPGDPDAPYDAGTPGLTPPSLVPGTRALPKYPDLARRAGLQGTVILLVVIEADGTVGEIEVIKNPDQRWGFDLAAIDAIKRWRYQPALMNGRPVAAYIQVMVEFTLAR
jgi:protein TonB